MRAAINNTKNKSLVVQKKPYSSKPNQNKTMGLVNQTKIKIMGKLTTKAELRRAQLYKTKTTLPEVLNA